MICGLDGQTQEAGTPKKETGTVVVMVVVFVLCGCKGDGMVVEGGGGCGSEEMEPAPSPADALGVVLSRTPLGQGSWEQPVPFLQWLL